MKTLAELKQMRADAAARADSIYKRAETEQRDLNEQEQADIDAALAEIDRLGGDIARRERFEASTAQIHAPQARILEPQPILNTAQAGPVQQRMGATVTPRNMGTYGFQSFGEFALAVRQASMQGRTPDPRLFAAGAAPVPANEGTGADGGFAVPPDYRNTIVQFINGDDSLIPRTDNIPTAANQITMPIDVTTPWQTTGGIQAYWEGEAALKTQSKPALDTQTTRLNKIIALVPITDELLEDAPAMDTYLRNKAPEKIVYKVNDAILNGDGTGKPLGVRQSAAKITVPAVAGQLEADPLRLANITAMWGAMYVPGRKRAVWLANPSAETIFLTMTIGQYPAYLPPGGLSASPYGTLLGRPVLYMENMAALGTAGDLLLVDLKAYMSATKVSNPGIRTDVSIHLWFDYDVTAYRFVLRIGGTPWWKAPMLAGDGVTQRSPYVELATRPES